MMPKFLRRFCYEVIFAGGAFDERTIMGQVPFDDRLPQHFARFRTLEQKK
ncbi:MAG TPA: hypothetical protein VGB17_09025 [Pyrinomonadaceae bacterium]|jgi:hypothetical protein